MAHVLPTLDTAFIRLRVAVPGKRRANEERSADNSSTADTERSTNGEIGESISPAACNSLFGLIVCVRAIMCVFQCVESEQEVFGT